MKIVRFIDSAGNLQQAVRRSDGVHLRLEGDLFSDFQVTDESLVPGRYLCPFPVKQILCIGLNYRRHAEETGAKLPEFPVLFMKGLNAVQAPGAPIVLPRALRSDAVDYECELAVVIGRPCRNVPQGRALDYVLGYTCANDVSARDWQKEYGGGQWCRGKTFDTFAPLGPYLVTRDEVPNPNALSISTYLNEERVQHSSTSDMIFSVARLIEFLSGSTTLLPGTVILTGTPEGVGMARKPPRYLSAGDRVRVEIEGLGSLENPVIDENDG